jgi:hypothetical protein
MEVELVAEKGRQARSKSPAFAPQRISPRRGSAGAGRVTGLVRFETVWNGQLRTCGIILARPRRPATDIAGLDLHRLAAAAVGRPGATASGKLVLLGSNGAAVFQTRPPGLAELVLCGNAAAAIALLSPEEERRFTLFGPDGARLHVIQRRMDSLVLQRWRLADVEIAPSSWHNCSAIHCRGLNRYTVVIGPLPAGLTPEDAGCDLARAGLGAKVVILSPRAGAATEAVFLNDKGRHGAAPATGLATLAILARRSALVRDSLPGNIVAYHAAGRRIEAPLPAASGEPDGSVAIDMPPTEVRLSLSLAGALS